MQPAPARTTAHAPGPARPSVASSTPSPAPSEPAPAPSETETQIQEAREHFNATQQTSSSTFTTGQQINAVPFSRTGEALETAIPGLLVTQHSGEGKANQYQLRGFQLDHGTDFAIFLDGMPLNMPTHGHGQGYADANFLIPELFAYVVGHKGPYYAEEGDFSAAGAAHVQYRDDLPDGEFKTTVGSFDYGRQLGINSNKVNSSTLLQAAEFDIYNGPWTVPDEVHKINGVLRWTTGTPENGLAIDAMAYANRWHASNQIPERAVSEGFISLWGNINPTDRGDTTRFSLSTQYNQTDANSHTKIEAFAIHTTLDLYNDFDYYLSQPLLGDQFRQFDRRIILGERAEHGWKYNFLGYPVETRIGVQTRYDDIRVGIQDTYDKMAFQTVTNDGVDEASVGLWTDTTVKWTPWLRTTGGVRYDYFTASVGDYQDPTQAVWLTSPTVPIGIPSFLWNPRTMAPYQGYPAWIWTGPWNSGSKSAALGSPKASIVMGPWEKTEFFFDYGEGFHSVDARATVTNLNPTDGSEAAKTAFLVKARGAEIGTRTKFFDSLDSTFTLWWLNFDSESQFDGDTGTTLFGRPSRRYGIEWTNHYSPYSWLHFDGDLTLSHARSRGWDVPQTVTYATLLSSQAIGYFTFLGNAPGNYIPEGPPIVASISAEIGEKTGWFGALKYRFKGVYPLTEDGYFHAPATGWLDLRGGYRWENGLKLQIDVFNALGARSDQITYAYGSLLPNDALWTPCQNGTAPLAVCAIGQMDRHFKPMEPTAVRVTLSGPLSATVFNPLLWPKPTDHTPLGDFMALADSVVAPPPPDVVSSGLPNKKGPVLIAPPTRWTGFYLGATTGAAWGGDNNIYYSTNPAGPGFDPGLAYLGSTFLGGGTLGNSNVAFLGGGEAGFNYQLNPRLVFGVETDFQGRVGGAGGSNTFGSEPSYTIPGNVLLGYYAGSQNFDYLGTARVRLGYVFRPTVLIYTTGGLAYGKTNLVANAQVMNINPGGNVVTLGGGSASSSQTRVGFSVGGGLEWMFAPGWSAKAEYLYYDLGN
ncbi:MAG TPA: TonB-dependent receptor, partial [Roseiarcus sp.]|nr:TonB-dependent receptor [Roseiarcus sp.]